MKLEAYGITDVGCVRTNNEDNFVCDTERALFVVCDGMGGHAAGEVASQLACEIITKQVDDLRAKHLPEGTRFTPAVAQSLALAMGHTMAEMSQTISAVGEREGQKKGMGTTCTALWFVDQEHALVAHIGDSRAYLFNPALSAHGHSCVCPITSDHTLVEELIARGLISAQEAKRHPQSHILSRALGASSGLNADCFFLRVDASDTFLLCSDGLHAYLPDAPDGVDVDPIGPPWRKDPSQPLEHTLHRLIDHAKSLGGHDNLTGVLIYVPPKARAPHDGHHSAPDDAPAALPQLLDILTTHPALGALPPVLLRRAAALTTPLDPTLPMPTTGIVWVAKGTLTLSAAQQDPGAPHTAQITTLEGPTWFAPEPVHFGNVAPARPTSSFQGEAWHLPAEALLYACQSHPTLGAQLLGGLMQHAALAATCPTPKVASVTPQ